jgi:hypothetical protein
MASIQVDKVYYVPHRDLVVLAGQLLGRVPAPGWSIDLPRSLRGPGWVPIADVQKVPFADGDRTCIVLHYSVLEGAPLMEFSDLEGAVLDYRP